MEQPCPGTCQEPGCCSSPLLQRVREGRKEGAHCSSLFMHNLHFHSNPAMRSASLGAAESKFSSLLALARIQLLSPAHTPAALCSSLGARAETLPKEHWGKPWVTCSAPSANPALSWRLYWRIPNTKSNPNNYIIFMNYKNVLAFFTGVSWATGVLILNKLDKRLKQTKRAAI